MFFYPKKLFNNYIAFCDFDTKNLAKNRTIKQTTFKMFFQFQKTSLLISLTQQLVRQLNLKSKSLNL